MKTEIRRPITSRQQDKREEERWTHFLFQETLTFCCQLPEFLQRQAPGRRGLFFFLITAQWCHAGPAPVQPFERLVGQLLETLLNSAHVILKINMTRAAASRLRAWLLPAVTAGFTQWCLILRIYCPIRYWAQFRLESAARCDANGQNAESYSDSTLYSLSIQLTLTGKETLAVLEYQVTDSYW